MTRTRNILALILAMSACTRDRKEETPPPTFTDEGVGAQQRISTSLRESVVNANLRTCWGQLQGPGAVAMDLTYRKSGDNWTLDNVNLKGSSLAKGQETIAQRCIEESARATTFPVDSRQPLETAAQEFVVRLGWPVPLPPENTDMTNDEVARMIGTGGGAGVITVPGCSDCVSNPNYPYGLKCEAKKSGSQVDCEEISSNVCATTPKACLRGLFGGTSGVIMF